MGITRWYLLEPKLLESNQPVCCLCTSGILLNRYNLRTSTTLANIRNEFLCSISKDLGGNRNRYFLILTKLEEQVKSSAHYFFACLCHLYWYCSHGKICQLLKILAQHDLVKTDVRVQVVVSWGFFVSLYWYNTVLSLVVGTCLKKSEANNSVLCCSKKRKT